MTTAGRSDAPDRMRRWPTPTLMLVTDRARLRGRRLEAVVSAAIDGGVNAVQLREKDLPTAGLYDLAITLRAVTLGRALLLVNERADVALAAGADGVHLPERSLPGEKVRGLLGEQMIVGRSVHGVEAARRAVAEGADYVEAGAVFETASKPGVAPAGVELVSAVADAVHVPVLAIGGITAARVAEVVAAGASGVAAIGALLDAGDACAAARELRHALDEAWR